MTNVVDINDHRAAIGAGPAQATPAPASLDAEQALIGAMLVNNDVFRVVSTIVEPTHFAEPLHARVWQIAGALIADGGYASPITLRTRLGDTDLGAGVTPASYLAGLAGAASTISQAPAYAKHIRDLALRRALVTIADEARIMALDVAADAGVGDVAKAIEDKVAAVRWSLEDHTKARDGQAGQIAASVVAMAREIAAGRGEPAVTTGIQDLDRKLPRGGLAPGGLHILAGRTGMGKTMVGASISRLAAIRGHGGAYFSLEVPSDEITARWMADSIGGGPTYGEILKGEVDESRWHSLEGAAEDLRALPLVVNDRSGLSIGDIAMLTERYGDRMARRNQTLKFIVIDHAQIVRPTDRYRSNRVNELGEVANEAKALAKRLGICVVLCSQLNRAVEGRDDKRPNLSDLRASGEVEEAADCIMMLYRPAYYAAKSAKAREGDADALAEIEATKNNLEILIEKARQGATGMVDLWCDPGRSSVRGRW